ncbi:LOB domain-containing protein 25-like [Phragmites australis]|uniref:LOB domain-containing protein 25-like n=1 Tax=Phragmites australis TaxID=29695 RepID=UPI002D797D1C|nr:LOB domain-containing protein 25-like [Phragmites australis]
MRTAMTGGVNGGACAVCKHQRRKCEPNCELAAYFPANRMNDFRALHLVFGVANLTKLIKANATEAARRRAADTLTWEARWRERDPSEGCYREVSCLRRENAVLRAENAALRRQAEQCAAATRHASTLQQQQLLLVSAYSGARTGSAPHIANNNGGSVIPGNFVGGCYNGDGSGGVRGANGNAVLPVRPHAPAPAAQTMFGYAQDDCYPVVEGRNGSGVPRSDAAIRGQVDSRDKDNAR